MDMERYGQRRYSKGQGANFDIITGFLRSIRIGRLVIGWESKRTIIPMRMGGKNKAGLIGRGEVGNGD